MIEASPGTHIFTIDKALDRESCLDIIWRFEASDKKTVGETSYGLMPDVKLSTDLHFSTLPEFLDVDKKIMQTLSPHFGEVIKNFIQISANYSDEGYHIQKTEPGQFYKPHLDHDPGRLRRILTAILYLNDVQEGGETYFPRFDISIRPEIGKLLLFPPFWTHRHEGLTPVSGTKYTILTALCWDKK